MNTKRDWLFYAKCFTLVLAIAGTGVFLYYLLPGVDVFVAAFVDVYKNKELSFPMKLISVFLGVSLIFAGWIVYCLPALIWHVICSEIELFQLYSNKDNNK